MLCICHHALSNCNRNVETLPDLYSLISIPFIIPTPHLPLRLKKAPLKPEDAEVLQRGTHTFTLSHMHMFTLHTCIGSHCHSHTFNLPTCTRSHCHTCPFSLSAWPITTIATRNSKEDTGVDVRLERFCFNVRI